jgi:two-component system, OmpR family, response regulator CpxR
MGAVITTMQLANWALVRVRSSSYAVHHKLTVLLAVRDPRSLDRRRNRALMMTVKKTILCVADEQSLSIHKLTLETRGYRVVTCNSAVEAMRLVCQRSVDLVLSNVDLPDAPAAELVGRLKTHSPEIPVVLLCAQQRPFNTDAPADLLLRKDNCAPAELLERIRLLLIKRRGPRRATPEAMAQRAKVC